MEGNKKSSIRRFYKFATAYLEIYIQLYIIIFVFIKCNFCIYIFALGIQTTTRFHTTPAAPDAQARRHEGSNEPCPRQNATISNTIDTVQLLLDRLLCGLPFTQTPVPLVSTYQLSDLSRIYP